MFVRTRKLPGKNGLLSYSYIVDNKWNPFKKKHEQKIIASLGKTEDLPINGTIEKMITALDTFATKMGFSALSDGIVFNDISSENIITKSFDYGSLLLTEHILRKLSLSEILTKVWDKTKKRKISKASFTSCCLGLISARLSPFIPLSELATHKWFSEQVYLPEKQDLDKDDWYRSLDVLIEHKDEIENKYYEQNKTLFNQALDIVLFDTTSIYYYGKQNPEKIYPKTDLLQYGRSKDGKGDLKQLIVGVLMTREGVPIAHEVFPGNTSDLVSFVEIIKVLKEKYKIGKVILIADRGMISEDNLRLLETEKLSYILGVRMRKLSPVLRDKLLVGIEGMPGNIEDMQKIKDNLYTFEYPLNKLTPDEITQIIQGVEKNINKKIKKLTKAPSSSKEKTALELGMPAFDKESFTRDFIKRKYFVCLNPYVAAANKKKREYFKEIIQKKIDTKPTKEWIVKNGYKKYINLEANLKLNEDKLKEEEYYDGKWVLVTNDETINSNIAGVYYKSLQFVERGFHDLKSLITVRPIYHWKEERIKAHIFVCFLSLIVKWYICKTINNQTQEDGRRFIEDMINLKAIEVDHEIPVFVRTTITPRLQEQMKKLEMKIPGKVIIDGRLKGIRPNPKGGRPRKINPKEFQLPLMRVEEKTTDRF